MPETLFDTTPYTAEPDAPAPKMSAQRRLTIRQTAALNQGWHPLTVAAQHHNGPAAARLKLHPQAAPPDNRHAPGRRCGNCWHLRTISTGSARDWPKCVYGAQNPTDDQPRPGPPPRVTKGPGSDIRRWWPACEDHTYGDPKLSEDAARSVPAEVDSPQWAPIVDFEGFYEVSTDGQIRSRPRPGTKGGLLTPKVRDDDSGYLSVGLYATGREETHRIHNVVLIAFVGPRPQGMVARHLDGDPTNNRLDNLCWGTSSENNIDQVRHGTHPHASKTHCPRGHPYDDANTYHHPNSERRCRICGGYRVRHSYGDPSTSDDAARYVPEGPSDA